ncbi:MAG: DUF4301 family protein, partial [Bacteroidota bacterium]
MLWNSEDLKQMKEHGVDPLVVDQQIELFKNGTPPVYLDRPCTVGDGIHKIDDRRKGELIAKFDQFKSNLKVAKFVPASGAASRMFKHLHQISDDSNPLVREFKEHFHQFPFAIANQEEFPQSLNTAMEWENVVQKIMNDSPFKFGSKPKGLIPFHGYQDEVRTPFEEHLIEAVLYGAGKNEKAHIHFTVPQASKADIQAHVDAFRAKLEEEYGVVLEVEFSVQNPGTDTIAVNEGNEPFRDQNKLFFRPGGHGALLHNLNKVDADLVFIKNIDNVVV